MDSLVGIVVVEEYTVSKENTFCDGCRQSLCGYRENAITAEPETTAVEIVVEVNKNQYTTISIAVMVVLMAIAAALFIIPVLVLKFAIGLVSIALVVSIIYGIRRLAKLINSNKKFMKIVYIIAISILITIPATLLGYIACTCIYELGNVIYTALLK